MAVEVRFPGKLENHEFFGADAKDIKLSIALDIDNEEIIYTVYGPEDGPWNIVTNVHELEAAMSAVAKSALMERFKNLGK